MTHASDATKKLESAIPTKNADGNVIEWSVQYKYTKTTFPHTFNGNVKIDTPTKAPSGYTKAEILALFDVAHWDDMYNKKYTAWTAPKVVNDVESDFDVSTLS